MEPMDEELLHKRIEMFLDSKFRKFPGLTRGNSLQAFLAGWSLPTLWRLPARRPVHSQLKVVTRS